MTKDDLLKRLDLGGAAAAAPAAPDLAITSAGPTSPATPARPTALAVDAWGLRRGRDLLAASARLKTLATDEFAAADFFTAAFDPAPRLLPAGVDRRRHEFLAQLLETPDYQALHTLTRLDDTAASIAAAAFAEQFAELKTEDDKEPGRDALGRERAALRAAALGLGPGSPGRNDAQAIAALCRRVRADPARRRICESAGRYHRLAQSRQRRQASHGRDGVVGVTRDGAPGRLLPHELAKLALPELEDDVLRRLAERPCRARAHQSVEPVAKGPILVVVAALPFSTPNPRRSRAHDHVGPAQRAAGRRPRHQTARRSDCLDLLRGDRAPPRPDRRPACLRPRRIGGPRAGAAARLRPRLPEALRAAHHPPGD